jgi:hypothetical protein
MINYHYIFKLIFDNFRLRISNNKSQIFARGKKRDFIYFEGYKGLEKSTKGVKSRFFPLDLRHKFNLILRHLINNTNPFDEGSL